MSLQNQHTEKDCRRTVLATRRRMVECPHVHPPHTRGDDVPADRSDGMPDLMTMCSYKGVPSGFFSNAPEPTRHNESLTVVRFESPEEYLRTMQAHLDAEYACGTQRARELVDNTKGGGWRRCRSLGLQSRGSRQDQEYVLAVEGCRDWLDDPWISHAVEFKGVDGVFLISSSGTAKSEDPPCPSKLKGLLWGMEGYAAIQGPKQSLSAFLGGSRSEYKAPGSSQSLAQMYARGGLIRSLGFVGSHLLAYRSAQKLRNGLASGLPERQALLHDVASPGPVSYAMRNELQPTLLPPPETVDLLLDGTLNKSQLMAIRRVREGVSIIHGPPGTGKSTTILHLINTRMPSTFKVLVTCTRNQAVEAVVGKLAVVTGGVLAFGLDKNLGEVTRAHTLKERTSGDPAVLFLKEFRDNWDIKLHQLPSSSEDKKRVALRSWLEQQRRDADRRMPSVLRDDMTAFWAGLTSSQQRQTVGAWRSLLEKGVGCLVELTTKACQQARNRILRDTRVYVCTIDSTPRLFRDMADHRGEDLSIDTVIVDEAGCVLETAIPILLQWAPSNLVLIGDHLQLPPYTSLDNSPHRTSGFELAMMRDGHHARSLMERCVAAGVPRPMLSTQYRMHPSICKVVSSLFYGNSLLSGPGMESIRSQSGLAGVVGGAVVWLDTWGHEKAFKNAGYKNDGEVTVILKALRQFIGKGKTVVIVTFYNAQKSALEEAIKIRMAKYNLEGVSVQSIDSFQGSEADVVMISTVRSHTPKQTLGSFMCDKHRLNVALSRAREVCVIVGNRREMGTKGGRIWKQVVRMYPRAQPSWLQQGGSVSHSK